MTVADALRETKVRVEQLYVEQRNACDDDAVIRRLYSYASAFDGWLPSTPEDTTIPVLYRDVTLFRDARFVAEHLFGATVEWLWTLSTVDKYLVKFVLLRRLDVESAATRILQLRALLLNHDLNLKLRIDDEEVAQGIASGAFHMIPVVEPSLQRPVIAVLPRKLQAEHLTARMMKKARLYGMMMTAHWTPSAQAHGVVLCNSLKDTSLLSQNNEFRTFIISAISQCMPIRMSAGFIANEPFLFRNVAFPALRMAFSKKLRERVHVISEDYDKVLCALPPECVPQEMGGARDVDSEQLVSGLLETYVALASGRPTTSQ